MISKKSLYVRIPEDLFIKIETSGFSKQDIVTEALRIYFDINSGKSAYQRSESDNQLIQTLQDENIGLKKLLETSNQEKSEILRLLNQSQVLQMQAQKQLSEAKESQHKKSWQFWKK